MRHQAMKVIDPANPTQHGVPALRTVPLDLLAWSFERQRPRPSTQYTVQYSPPKGGLGNPQN